MMLCFQLFLIWTFSLAPLGTFNGYCSLSNLAKAPVLSFRGFQRGAFCLHCSEHRNVAETEGNPHFYSKGANLHTHTYPPFLLDALCTMSLRQIFVSPRGRTNQISFHIFVFTEWGLLHSWETGLQTALYLHLLPNHYSLLQVGVSVSLKYQNPRLFSVGRWSPTLLKQCEH